LNTTTFALQSAIVWAGTAFAGIFYGQLTDLLGRKKAMWITAVITLLGAVLQTAAQNIAMFVVARFIVGVGNGAAFLCGPVYLSEVLPMKWRGVGLGIFMSFFYVGRSRPVYDNMVLWLTKQFRWTSLCRHHLWHSFNAIYLGLATTVGDSGRPNNLVGYRSSTRPRVASLAYLQEPTSGGP
jgi:MFS family permease